MNFLNFPGHFLGLDYIHNKNPKINLWRSYEPWLKSKKI